MNRLWVRLSIVFGLVLIISMSLAAVVMRLNYAYPGIPPPPEVVAYFKQIQQESLVPNPVMALGTLLAVAVVAGIVASRILAGPMSDLEEAATKIGRGKFDTRVEPRGSQEMIAVAAAFNEMAAQLEQSEALRKRMFSDIAHELRHPLHVLQGNLQAMLDGVYPIDEDEIERLIAQTHHLTVMVNDLGLLAQAEARQLPLHTQEVDIAALLKEVTAVYKPTSSARGIDLHVALLGTLPAAMQLDRARIRQAIQNLLENSLRHTGDGGKIAITAYQEASRLLIEVRDDGEGIASDQLPFVFDRLYRGDTARQRDRENTGLGLPISSALVEAHGGTITAESPGETMGSTFIISLPLKLTTS
jgi:signal transduction histidine kinase